MKKEIRSSSNVGEIVIYNPNDFPDGTYTRAMNLKKNQHVQKLHKFKMRAVGLLKEPINTIT